MRRIHNPQATSAGSHSNLRSTIGLNQNAEFVCSIESCKKICHNRCSLIKHLRSHFKAHEIIWCPFEWCDKKYNRLNAFTGHSTRKHKSVAEVNAYRLHEMEEENNIDDGIDQTARRIISLDDECANISDARGPNIDNIFAIDVFDCFQTESYKDPFLVKVDQVYRKLECQFLLPASTIQYIVSKSFNTHELSQEAVTNHLKSRLLDDGLTPEKVIAILDDILKNDQFETSLNTLKTTYERRQFNQKECAYVEPI